MASMACIQHDFAEVNGVRLHYAHAGDEQASRLLLFVHGFPEFWYAWRRQLAEFGRDCFAVAPDMRGYNLSEKPAAVGDYRIERLVEDLRQLARHLGHSRFILAGHDWGGVAAWVCAALHAEDVEKLIIINSPHPAVFRRELRHNSAQQRASLYMLFFRTPLAEPVLRAFRYALLRRTVLGEGLKEGYFTAEDEAAYLAAWSQPGALTGGLNYYRAARIGPPTRGGEPVQMPAGPAAFTVQVPTLVLWGERDRYLLPGNLAGLEEFVPRLTLRRFPDAGHWIIHQMPDPVNQHIREFLIHG